MRRSYWAALASGMMLWPVAAAAADIQPLQIEMNGVQRSLSAAFGVAQIVEVTRPYLEALLDKDKRVRNAAVRLVINAPQGQEAKLSADTTASYEWLTGALPQWTRIHCTLEATLRLTAPLLRDARLEITSDRPIARDCTASGEIAKALGANGTEVLTAFINSKLGQTPWSQPVNALLSRPDAKKLARQYFHTETIPPETQLKLAGCAVSGVPAVCASIDLP